MSADVSGEEALFMEQGGTAKQTHYRLRKPKDTTDFVC